MLTDYRILTAQFGVASQTSFNISLWKQKQAEQLVFDLLKVVTKYPHRHLQKDHYMNLKIYLKFYRKRPPPDGEVLLPCPLGDPRGHTALLSDTTTIQTRQDSHLGLSSPSAAGQTRLKYSWMAGSKGVGRLLSNSTLDLSQKAEKQYSATP